MYLRKKIRKSRDIAVVMALTVSPFANLHCATSEENRDAPKEVIKTHYTLTKGKVIEHPFPLPSEVSIQVNWHFSDGHIESSDAFRGWDFTGDGEIDFLEVLNPDKEVQAMAFDFDFDGKVDVIKEKN